MENQEQAKNKNSKSPTTHTEEPAEGINDWNDRLDKNLEPDNENDIIADENAKDFSENFNHDDTADQAE